MTPSEIVSQIERHLGEAGVLAQQLRSMLATGARPAPLPRLAASLAGGRWTERTARAAVGILVHHARTRAVLTYGDLHREVVKAGGQSDVGTMQKYSSPLDRICTAFAAVGSAGGPIVPVLTTLVINGRDKLPSPGVNPHVRNWLHALGEHGQADQIPLGTVMRKDQFDHAVKSVFDYGGWDEAIRSIGLSGDPAFDLDLV